MAEAPAAAPANTKDTLLANIKALIKNTFDEEEPRGNNTASLAVHAAMAAAMADVITDYEITQNCEAEHVRCHRLNPRHHPGVVVALRLDARSVL